MSLELSLNTDSTLSATVAGGDIGDWTFDFTVFDRSGNVLAAKSSTNSSQIAILDAGLGTLEIYMLASDLSAIGSYQCVLNASVYGKHIRLIKTTLNVSL